MHAGAFVNQYFKPFQQQNTFFKIQFTQYYNLSFYQFQRLWPGPIGYILVDFRAEVGGNTFQNHHPQIQQESTPLYRYK